MTSLRRPQRRMGAYEAVTRGILVRVRPEYLPDQSDPAESRYVWAYQIEVENRGQETVQLFARHWIITDANGKVEEVRGPGVVGEQPTLKPGEAFRYASGCPLGTPSGSMVGSFEMHTDDGERFEAAVPGFSLDLPDARRTVN
jgi:ApaG protein